MSELETSNVKVKKICEIIKKETLEPAQQEAKNLLEQAHRQADEILSDAHLQANKIKEDTYLELERQKTMFQASLNQACQMALTEIKQKIETQLFNPALLKLIRESLKDEKTIARMIEAVIQAIIKGGIDTDLNVAIASSVSPSEVYTLLSKEVVERIKKEPAVVSTIGGGIKVKLVEDNIVLDLSDAAFEELIASYIRKDFKKHIFKA